MKSSDKLFFMLSTITFLAACHTPKNIEQVHSDLSHNVHNPSIIAKDIPVKEDEALAVAPLIEDAIDIEPRLAPAPSFNISSAYNSLSGGGKRKKVAHVCFEYIINGGFETGDFRGFNVDNSGSGNWYISSGDPTPESFYDDGLDPISGAFDVVSDQQGPGLHLLTQPIIIPPNLSLARLEFKDRIRNRENVFVDPNQEYRVMLKNSLLEPIQELFSTNPGDQTLQFGPNERSIDLTALLKSQPGESIVISFEEQDDLFYFNVNLDDISLQICSSCGNRALQGGEECDDGNNQNGDGCSQACQIEE